MIAKQPSFKHIHYVLPNKDINESLAANYENIGGTKTQTVTRRPAGFTYDVELLIVTKTQLSILYSMQKGVNEKLFTVFIQRKEDGPISLYKNPRPLLVKRKPSDLAQLVRTGNLQSASQLAQIFYVGATHEQNNAQLKVFAEDHELQKGRFFVGEDRSIKKLLFYTPYIARVTGLLNDKNLPPDVKADIKMYLGGPHGPKLCNPDFSPIV